MLAGQLYDASDPQLVDERRQTRNLLAQLNHNNNQPDHQQEICSKLFGTMNDSVTVESPFYCDYGTNIYLGERVFFNFNCVILDPGEVHIGNDVQIGPAVQIYTASHPLDWRVRRQGLETVHPVKIDSDVWIGGSTTICPGVTIGCQSVIGAGAVVTKDMPSGVLAAGNPCEIIRM